MKVRYQIFHHHLMMQKEKYDIEYKNVVPKPPTDSDSVSLGDRRYLVANLGDVKL